MLLLGDAHASDPAKRSALLAAYEAANADVALQAGDLECYDPPVETWFVAGNNEDFDVVERLRRGESTPEPTNVRLLASEVAEVEGVRVAGLSGNFAPTKFERTREELAGDERRHFVRGDVERLARLDDVDVLLTHEAPKGLLHYGYDPGCDHVNDLLDALEPDRCFVGHHHTHRTADIAGCRVVSLDPAWERYYLLDPHDLSLEAFETPTATG